MKDFGVIMPCTLLARVDDPYLTYAPLNINTSSKSHNSLGDWAFFLVILYGPYVPKAIYVAVISY